MVLGPRHASAVQRSTEEGELCGEEQEAVFRGELRGTSGLMIFKKALQKLGQRLGALW